MGVLIARIVLGLILLGGVAMLVALYYLHSKYWRRRAVASSSAIMHAGDPGAAGFGGGSDGGGCDGGGSAC